MESLSIRKRRSRASGVSLPQQRQRETSNKLRLLNRLASGLPPPLHSSERSSSYSRRSSTSSTKSAPRPLARPEQMTACIQMTLEEQSVPPGSEIPTLFGIELKNKSGSDFTQPAQPICKIDAVIVLDNSCNNYSPNDTVLMLSAIFNKHDRLALMVTHGSEDTCQVLLPLGNVTTRQLRSCLDSVNTTSKPNNVHYLHNAVLRARIMLLDAPESEEPGSVGMTMGHIFLLTSNGSAFSDPSVNHPLVQTHIVCDAAIPERHARDSKNNGWSVYRACRLPNFHKAERKVLDDDFKCALQNLVDHAHAGRCSQALSDVQMWLNAGEKCSIRGVMGATKISYLRPGESRTVFVRVRVDDDLPAALAKFPRGLRTPSGHMDVVKEIDAILGERRTVLIAKLRYANPGLLNGTICEYTRNVQL